ncbi:MAG: LmeA family phospholipid-binding protein [Candidatus Riflebacteria bacterium]|nr:LmeA family phospholipid-binding protein [Candidatus Riflebacteria bacterium]
MNSSRHRMSWSALALAAALVLGGGVGSALPMNPHRIAEFEREALDVLQWLMGQPHQEQGDETVFTVTDGTVKGFRVKSGEVRIAGLSKDLRQALGTHDAGFDDLRKIGALRARADLAAGHLREFIEGEIAKAHGKRRIFEAAGIDFKNGQVEVSGLVNLDRVPGNPLAFLPQSASPFHATVKLAMEGDQLVIDIIEAQVNSQPMTPELRTQILGWLNPLWDFSEMPYPARLETVDITPAGIAASGWLFAP